MLTVSISTSSPGLRVRRQVYDRGLVESAGTRWRPVKTGASALRLINSTHVLSLEDALGWRSLLAKMTVTIRRCQGSRVRTFLQDQRVVDEHFQRLIRGLDQEAEAETREVVRLSRLTTGTAAERSGGRLLGLAIRDEASGFGGRVLVTLGKRDQRLELPWTRLNVVRL